MGRKKKQKKEEKSDKPEKKLKSEKRQTAEKTGKSDKKKKAEKALNLKKKQKEAKLAKPEKRQEEPKKKQKKHREEKTEPLRQKADGKLEEQPQKEDLISETEIDSEQGPLPTLEKDKNEYTQAASEEKTVQEPEAESVKTPAAADSITDREILDILRALGDETRMQIYTLLEDGEMCAADLLKSLDIVQSTLSHHMKVLTDTGLVKCRKQGKWSWYSINNEMMVKVATYMMKWG